jgi:hypothetical protein
MLREVDVWPARCRHLLPDEREGCDQVFDQEGRVEVPRSAEWLGMYRPDVQLLRCLLGDRVRRADSYADTHADAHWHRRSDAITDGVCRTDSNSAVRLGV